MERDFKGVWIPKEIWLNKELSMIDKGILTEIASLDGENHCYASNEYLAEFCQVSVATVGRSIKKLINLGYIEVVAFTGRTRLVKLTRQTSQIDQAASSNCQPINIDNNRDKKFSISKDIENTKSKTQEFEFGKHKEPKQSLYNKCTSLIDNFSDDTNVRQLLKQFLSSLSEMSKLRGQQQFAGILNKLKSLSEDPKIQVKIIKHSIEHGYATFYDINNFGYNKNRPASSDIGHHPKHYTPEEKEQIKRGIKDGTAEKF